MNPNVPPWTSSVDEVRHHGPRAAETKLFHKLTKLIGPVSFGEICSEIGKFVEAVTINECWKETRRTPRNTKEAVDSLAAAAIISATLAAKLHVVRTLRNAYIHELTNEVAETNVYRPTKADARFAVQILNEFLTWLHEEKVEAEWNRLLKKFQRELRLVDQKAIRPSDLVGVAYNVLRDAIELKLRSLGLKPVFDITSGIESLLKHGIDVRSEAWKKLAILRVYQAHGTPQHEELLRSEHMIEHDILPELPQVLAKLNPLRRSESEQRNCPQVPLSVLEALGL